MEETDKIELRSEKVRHIIGEIPPGIVRYGIMIITLVVLGLLAAAYFIPYPETANCKAVATDATHVSVLVPYRADTGSRGLYKKDRAALTSGPIRD